MGIFINPGHLYVLIVLNLGGSVERVSDDPRSDKFPDRLGCVVSGPGP